MKALNCEDYMLTILFDENKFRVEDFKEEIGVKDKDESEFVFEFNSKNKRKKEHSHIQIEFDKDQSILRATFHTGRLEDEEDVSGFSSEECLKEVGRFFDEENCVGIATATFQYNQKYEPIMALNFPLLLSTKHLQGAEISGYEMRFPKTSELRRIFISNNEGNIRLIIHKKTSFSLAEFNHYSEIQKLLPITEELIRKKGGNNDERTEK